MTVRQISKEELTLKTSSVFYSEKWINILGDNTKAYGIFNANEEIIGGFLLSKEKVLGLNIFRQARLMTAIQLFYKNSSKNYSKHAGEEKKLMQMLADFFEELPYHILTVYFPAEYVDMQPFIWSRFKVIPYYTYIIDLSESVSVIEEKFAPERRNDIKKAIKDGIICKKENCPDIVKRIALNSFMRKEKKIDLKIFDKVLFDFSDPGNSITFISYQNEIPIAAVFCVYDKEKIYYLIGGYDNEFKHQGAGALALYSAIKYAKEIGVHYFDFEGSMIPEVEKYFRGFGGVLTPYYSINKAKLPLEMALKLFRRSVF